MVKYAAGSAKRNASTRSSTPPCPASRRPLSFTSRSRLNADSKRSPSAAATVTTTPRTIESCDREEVLVVERDEDGEDAGGGPGDEAFPRLRRRDRRRELVPADCAPDQIRRGVVDPDGDDHRERGQPAVGHRAQKQQEARARSRSRRHRSTVELIAAVAGARVVATRKKRNASTSVARKPPSIHSTPPSFAPTSAAIAPA